MVAGGPELMWTVVRPNVSAQNSFLTAISRITNNDLKNRMESIEETVVAASEEFENAVAVTALHTLTETDGVAKVVTTDEMVDLYDQRFAKEGSAGRSIYDAIRSAPRFARCPLCGHGTVWTLDHHLPKRRFPALSVSPINLVPACMECNKFKLAAAPQTAADETIHPYFDNVENDLWLKANVIEVMPAALRFYVDAPNDWPVLLSERVRRHFEMLKLPYRYSVEAAREIINLEKVLARLSDSGGPHEVRNHLNEMAQSYASARVNSWQTAMYAALAENVWFSEGGFAT